MTDPLTKAFAAPFTEEMTVGQALAAHPHARWVFAAYHLSGCTNCASSVEETIAEVGEAYGISVEKLLTDLNSLVGEGQSFPGGAG